MAGSRIMTWARSLWSPSEQTSWKCQTSVCRWKDVHVCSVAQSCPTLRPHGLEPIRLLCSWGSPGKNTGVGCHFVLQGIFLTQGSNLRLLHWRFFTTEPPIAAAKRGPGKERIPYMLKARGEDQRWERRLERQSLAKKIWALYLRWGSCSRCHKSACDSEDWWALVVGSLQQHDGSREECFERDRRRQAYQGKGGYKEKAWPRALPGDLGIETKSGTRGLNNAVEKEAWKLVHLVHVSVEGKDQRSPGGHLWKEMENKWLHDNRELGRKVVSLSHGS